MADFLFHGTTRRYHDMVVYKFGRYQHDDGNPVYLAIDRGVAMIMAMSRGKQFDDEPVILEVDLEAIIGFRTQEEGGWGVCDFLESEWYRKMER
jgi:hypothetical protein